MELNKYNWISVNDEEKITENEDENLSSPEREPAYMDLLKMDRI